jgi:Tfp pilus assembly protein PilW
MIAVGVGSLVLILTASLSLYASKNFATTTSYVDLDQAGRLALDSMSREIRQATRVAACLTNEITFLSGPDAFRYQYNPNSRTLARVQNGVTRILLTSCDYARFDMFQRNATNGTYDYYPTANTNSCKVVQLTWACSKTLPGVARQTSVQQSARVVIRKQK